MVLFVIVGIKIIQCTIDLAGSSATCISSDFTALATPLSAGLMELLFEIKGIARIYRVKDK